MSDDCIFDYDKCGKKAWSQQTHFGSCAENTCDSEVKFLKSKKYRIGYGKKYNYLEKNLLQNLITIGMGSQNATELPN